MFLTELAIVKLRAKTSTQSLYNLWSSIHFDIQKRAVKFLQQIQFLKIIAEASKSVTKIIESLLYFHENVLKNVRYAQKYPEFHLPVVQCFANSGTAMSASSHQE